MSDFTKSILNEVKEYYTNFNTEQVSETKNNSQSLTNARVNKNDEFYTDYEDIEKEMKSYGNYFQGKSVFCNCDDADRSQFVTFFENNFGTLGLRRLVAIGYCANGHGKMRIVDNNGSNDYALEGNGDFRSSESLTQLWQCDVVVTNPPFSLFRELIALITQYGKDYIVLGNMNASTCKDIFPMFKDNKMWYGPSITCGDRKFYVPDEYPLEAAGCGIDDNGKRYVRVKGVRWFTNIDHAGRHTMLHLDSEYDENNYRKYDNSDAINVSKTKDIPKSYDGVMGVPITFLDKYNPDQFEILGLDKDFTDDKNRGMIDGKRLYARVFIRHKPQNNKDNTNIDNE